MLVGGENLDVGKTGCEFGEKTLLALLGAGRADLDAQQDDVAFPV